MQKWEYASVSFIETWTQVPKGSEWLERVHPDWHELRRRHLLESGYFLWIQTGVLISMPGADPDWRSIKDATMAPGAQNPISVHTVLNELGAQGWELVSECVMASTIGLAHGIDRAGRPIETSCRLKRPISP